MKKRTESAFATHDNESAKQLYRLNEIVADFCNEQLKKSSLSTLDSVKINMGFSDKTIEKFKIGYFSKQHGELLNLIEKNGFDRGDLATVGLVCESDENSFYLEDRIIFPVFDVDQNIISFSGRRLSENQHPKWKSLRDTIICEKSTAVYGLNFAKDSTTPYFLLVEGILDVVALHQSGYPSALSICTTNFTMNHANQISLFKQKAVIYMDSDKCGKKAAKRTADILQQNNISTHIINSSGYLNPQDIARDDGVKAFKDIVDNISF